MNGQPIPHDETIEFATIGACLLDPSAMVHAVTTLDPGDFYDPRCRSIFAAMCAAVEEGEPPDMVLLSSRTGIPIGTLADMTRDTGSTLAVSGYCGRLALYGTLRTALLDAQEAIQAALASHTPEDGIASLVAAGATLATIDVEKREMHSALEVGRELQAHLDTPKGVGSQPVPTGIPGLDDILAGGFRPGQLVVIGARPACGKSALACNTIALHVAHTGRRVLVFSLEMDRIDLMRRMVSAQSRAPLTQLLRRDLHDDERVTVRDTIGEITELDLHFDDRPTMTVKQIAATSRRMARKRKVGLVVVDYLQLVKGVSASKSTNREQEVASISRDLKGLARELGCPVIALSQLNRGGGEGEPKDSDLRESGAIEQDADVIVMLWPLGVTDDGAAEVEIGCKVAKQRGGRRGRLRLIFDAPHTDFRDGGELGYQDAPTTKVNPVPKYARAR